MKLNEGPRAERIIHSFLSRERSEATSVGRASVERETRAESPSRAALYEEKERLKDRERHGLSSYRMTRFTLRLAAR